MIVIVGCEESQAVCLAFRAKGHEAYSCDLKPCSGGHPDWHFECDIFQVLKAGTLTTQSGKTVFIKSFDLAIFHPTCTFVARSSVQWLSHPEDKHLPFELRRPHPRYPNRREDMRESVKFVKALWDSNIPRVAIENPVGLLSSLWRKPNQIINPWQFGDEATKTTCLWFRGLPLLKPTKIVGKGARTFFASGKSHPEWYAEAMRNAKTKAERQEIRSKTFPGIANAMADQWGTPKTGPAELNLFDL